MSSITAKSYSLPLPPPYTSTPYRFLIQVTKIGPSTMVWAGLGTVSENFGQSEAGPSSLREDVRGEMGGIGADAAGGGGRNEYESMLAEAAGGPDAASTIEEESVEPSDQQLIGNKERIEASRRLGSDWGVAMPSRLQSQPTTSATLLVSTLNSDSVSKDDIAGDTSRATAMAARLSKRTNKQIFLSLSLPSSAPSLTGTDSSSGGALPGGTPHMVNGQDPLMLKLVGVLERGLRDVLEEKK